MTILRATDADIPLILRGLAATPNPPNENEDSIAAIIEASRFFYVDTVQLTFAYLSPRLDPPEDEEIDTVVVYWITPGKLNPAKHTPVLGVACRAVRRAHPELGPARIWGDFPGAGDTATERKADSTRQAQEHDTWMGTELSDKDADNPKMRRGQSTLDAVIAGIDEVEAAG